MTDLLYFAYGSNMLRQRLDARCPHIELAGVAALADHRLTFDQYSPVDDSGKAGIEAAPGQVVHGVLWSLPPADWPALDRAEARGTGYERVRWAVTLGDGRSLDVMTYLPLDMRSGLKPWDWYLNLVIAGAEQHGLPEAYVAWLKQVSCNVDGLPDRLARRTGLDALERAWLAV